MAGIAELRAGGNRFVGFYGCPPRQLLREWAERTGGVLLDLDVPCGAAPSGLVPEAYCRIIENIVANARALAGQLDVIVAAVGADKCDSGRYAAWLLRQQLQITIVEVENTQVLPDRRQEPLLCQAQGAVRSRVLRIMDTVTQPLSPEEQASWRGKQAVPTHGFWGVPPNNLELLDLFPHSTALFGWVRCVEVGAPADVELECALPPGLPTVFFVQAFCSKALLARQLAEEHRGLFVDVHDRLTGSVAAKVEAFITLARPFGG